MKCVNCGQEIPDNSQFCGYCGTKVEPKLSSKRFCTSCGKELKTNAKFCTSCGASVVTSKEKIIDNSSVNLNVNYSKDNIFSKSVVLGTSSFYVTEIVGIICLIFALLSLFLPYVGTNLLASTFSITLITGPDGIMALFIIIISLILAIFHKPLVSMIGCILSTLIPIIEITVNMQEEYGVMLSFYFGFYLLLFVSIVGCISFLLAYLEQRKMRKL